MRVLSWVLNQSYSRPNKKKFGHTKRHQGCAHTEERPYEDTKEGGHFQDKKKNLKEMIPANTLILDSSLQNSGKEKCLLFTAI